MIGACCCSPAMNTVNPNPSISQAICCCCGDGGASNVAAGINAIGKWGTVLLATTQGKPVQVGKTSVGAKGATSIGGMQSGSLILIAIVIIAAILLLRK